MKRFVHLVVAVLVSLSAAPASDLWTLARAEVRTHRFSTLFTAHDVRDHLAGTFLAHAPMVPVSATTGVGLDELRAALGELVDSTPAAADRRRPRLWVDRVFAAKGSGTVVTGTLSGGALHVDQQLHAGGYPVRVRGLQSHGEQVATLGPGGYFGEASLIDGKPRTATVKVRDWTARSVDGLTGELRDYVRQNTR